MYIVYKEVRHCAMHIYPAKDICCFLCVLHIFRAKPRRHSPTTDESMFEHKHTLRTNPVWTVKK